VTLRLLTGGAWQVKMGGRCDPAQVGDVFLALPSEPIDFAQLDPEADWEWYEIQFNGEAAEELAGEFGVNRSYPVITPVRPRQTDRLFRHLYALMGQPDRNPNAAMSAVLRLAYCCGGETAAKRIPGETQGSSLVRRAITMLENDPSSQMNVKEIAQRLGVDRTTLGRAFKQHSGHGPHHFIDSYRQMKVTELLHHSTMSVEKIAAAAGFRDVKYFINWFRRRTGCSPGRFRRDAE
jgi:AraC-like DNA-binding protein